MSSSRPNILFVVVDSLRARNVGGYGYQRNTTPYLDSMAKESLVYDWAWSPAIWTLPSHISMMTGLEVNEHQITSSADAIDPSAIIFDELANQFEYATGIFSENTWLTEADMGIHDAFETVVGKPSVVYPGALRPGEFAHQNEYGQYWKYLRESLQSSSPLKSLTNGVSAKIQYDAPQWLSRRLLSESSGQYFVDQFLNWEAGTKGHWAACINLMDAHRPYEPDEQHDNWDDGTARRIQSKLSDPVWPFINEEKPTWMLRALESLYDGGIRQVDACICKLVQGLKKSGSFSDTLLIVVGDHGEGFGESSYITDGIAVEHKQGLHSVQTHVPLLVNGPSAKTGRIEEPVSATEVARVIHDVVTGEKVDFTRDRPVLTVCTNVAGQLVSGEGTENETAEIESIIERRNGTTLKHTRIADVKGSTVTERLPTPQCSYEADGVTPDFDEVFDELEPRDVRSEASIGEEATRRLEDLGYV